MVSSLRRKKRVVRDTKGKDTSADRKFFSGFSKIFYQHVPAEDAIGWNAANLNIAVDSMCGWAVERISGKQKVRVFTPEQKRDGWHTPHTVIQIVNDDIPFIVDSVAAELASQNLMIDILFHPTLNALRGKGGKLKDINADKDNDETYTVESWVFIQLEQMLTEENSVKLEVTLNKILDDARVVAHDLKSIMTSLDKVIKGMPKFAAPVSRVDLREAQDFLKYLQKGNFTFLGYRAFRFSEADEKLQSGIAPGSDMGVLKGNDSLCFGHGVDSPEVKALRCSKSPVMISKMIDQYSTVYRRAPMDAISVKIVDEKGNLTGMHLFVGLFTFGIYSCRTKEVPIVRQKVRRIVQRADFSEGTRDRTSLENILERMPRDELFQVPCGENYAL